MHEALAPHARRRRGRRRCSTLAPRVIDVRRRRQHRRRAIVPTARSATPCRTTAPSATRRGSSASSATRGPPDALLVMHSDGLASHWTLDALSRAAAAPSGAHRRRALSRLQPRPRRRDRGGRRGRRHEHAAAVAWRIARRARRRRRAAARAPDRRRCSASTPPTRRGIATAVSEIARNAFLYAGGGRVEFAIEGTPRAAGADDSRQRQRAAASPTSSDVLAGRYRSTTGMGLGIVGARRLMDDVRHRVDAGAARRSAMKKLLPARGAADRRSRARRAWRDAGGASARPARSTKSSSRTRSCCGRSTSCSARQDELERVNRELEDTNRGVVALYAELDERADHLRRADEVKTRFLSNMTHEFRTPVNSILALDEPARRAAASSARAEGRGLLHPQVGAAAVGAGQRPARPRQGRGRQDRGAAGAVRGRATCSARCAACCGRCWSTSRSSLVFEEPTALPPSAPTRARSRRSCATSSRTR